MNNRSAHPLLASRRKSICMVWFVLLLFFTGCGGGGENATLPNSSNLPPTADAGGGAERIVNPGDLVSLDGSGSTDPDGEIVSYRWMQTDGVQVALTGADTVAASFIAPVTVFRELLVFQLKVEDNLGAQSSDSVTITVNVAPAADAGPDQFVYGASAVALNGIAEDEDGVIISHLWEQTGGAEVGLMGETTPTLNFLAPPATDTLTFRYTVTDNNNAQHSDSVSIYVSQVLFSDSFDSSSTAWTVVDDPDLRISSDWRVVNGKYRQLNDRVYRWEKSYHLGTYAYYNGGLGLTDYQVRVSLKSNALANGDIGRDTIGVKVRYQDPDNYIRLLMSRMNGFLRLESKVDGQFKPLGQSGRGINIGEAYDVLIDVRCGESDCTDGKDSDGDGLVDEFILLAYLNDELIFSYEGAGPTSGSVALFAQDRSEFDNVVVAYPPDIPRVGIQYPLGYSVVVPDNNSGPYELHVLAKAVSGPPNYGVKLTIDSGFPNEIIDFSGDFSGTFTNVPQGERTVAAIMVDPDGEPLANGMGQDTVVNMDVGVGGKFLVGFGDSITSGVGDDRLDDNDSSNVKMFGRGYTPILTSLLAAHLGASSPVVVVNEGLGGNIARDGRDRLDETLERYPESQVWLILFGTNDSTWPIPSGVTCREPIDFTNNSTCENTFKGHLREVVITLKANGQVPVLGLVPYVQEAPTARVTLINQYNQVITDLVTYHNLPVDPPDFYNYFRSRPDLFFDDVHPNGNGHAAMAQLWFDALIDSGIWD